MDASAEVNSEPSNVLDEAKKLPVILTQEKKDPKSVSLAEFMEQFEPVKTKKSIDEFQVTENDDTSNVQNSNPRVQYVVNKPNGRSGKRIETNGKGPTPKNTEAKSNIAFIVKEFWKDSSGTEKDKTQIILKSQKLRELMHDVLGKHLDHDKVKTWIKQDQSINHPFRLQLHYWEELEKASKPTDHTDEARGDLKLLLENIEYLEPDDLTVMKTISTKTKISSKDVWVLFRPGDLVISRPFLDEPQAFRVQSYSPKKMNNDNVLSVVCWAFDWTGTEVIQRYYEFHIKIEDGEIDISDLPCYPIKYHKNRDGALGDEVVKNLKAELITRGQQFRKLCKESKNGKQCTYDGQLLFTPRASKATLIDLWTLRPHREEPKRQMIREDIMIDFAAYEQYGPSRCNIGNLSPLSLGACKCKLCFDERYKCRDWIRDFATNKEADSYSKDELENFLLLPARAFGYCLTKKIWGQFQVEKVKNIEFPNASDFENKLVFPEDLASIKQDLKTLIELHGSTKASPILDPIVGKGSGLVILLHGPPGVGKTLTAETLAKSSGKPLFFVGASDIGLMPQDAEENLTRIFELAERWQAVLLIDEADVFLDSRGTRGEAETTKNALVSVMLRVLEYFKGILIMTTNRVLTFDVAMLSRCHYAINFRPLELSQEKKIWQVYVDQLNERNSVNKEDIQDWVKLITKKRTKLSGREIRNVFTTAQTLAQAEHNRKLTREHLERIYDRQQDFLEAMEKTVNSQQPHLNAGLKT